MRSEINRADEGEGGACPLQKPADPRHCHAAPSKEDRAASKTGDARRDCPLRAISIERGPRDKRERGICEEIESE